MLYYFVCRTGNSSTELPKIFFLTYVVGRDVCPLCCEVVDVGETDVGVLVAVVVAGHTRSPVGGVANKEGQAVFTVIPLRVKNNK